jgi:hypothetical protein
MKHNSLEKPCKLKEIRYYDASSPEDPWPSKACALDRLIKLLDLDWKGSLETPTLSTRLTRCHALARRPVALLLGFEPCD